MDEQYGKTVNQKAGLVQVYTSPSKQTNYAPFGLALRASGHGFRSLITRFAPHDLADGETEASRLLAPNLVIDASASAVFSKDAAVSQPVRDSFKKAWDAAASGAFDVVVMDGVLDLVLTGAIPLERILRLIQEKADFVELLLTGSGAAPEIIEKADLVTEMVVHKNSPQKNHEIIEVVTGKGKGKTTYCLGKALLMSSMNVPSYIVQAIKSPKPYGEVVAINNLPALAIETMGKGLVNKKNPHGDPSHGEAAREAWERGKEIIFSGRYGLVVLDEINIAVNYEYVQATEVREFLLKKPQGVHLILSGRYAKPPVMEPATSVLEMKEIKHPAKKGIRARRGIEF